MSASIQAQLAKAENKLRISQAKLACRRTEAALAKFDVLQSHAQRKRRQPVIERENEESLLRLYDRLRAINLCRDLERNFTSAKSIIGQVRTNVVGCGPKIRVHGIDEARATEAAEWFNGWWQAHCDFRTGRHFAEHLADAVAAVVREGDILEWFDDGWIENSGQIGWFEADQLVEVEDPAEGSPSNQSGVVFDKLGRELGYAVTAKRGSPTAKRADVTILPREVARLVRLCWRPNQLRGTPLMLTTAADLQDLYEMRAKELQTAKVGASVFGKVKKNDAVSDLAMKREGGWTEAGGAGTSGNQATAYDRLESFTGGNMEYMEPDEDIQLLDFNRPSLNFHEAHDRIASSAGAALGMAQTHALLKVAASYTAFRGELLLSWSTFRVLQKLLERQSCDWTAGKALAWGIAQKRIAPVDLAAARFSWDWPTMPAVDTLKEAMAVSERLRTLQTDYAEELGPDWRKRFEALNEQAKTAKQLELPLLVWEAQRSAITFSE